MRISDWSSDVCSSDLLKPEKAVDLQLTASRRIGNVKVTLTGYRQDVRQPIFSQTIAIPDSVTGDLTQSSLMTNIGKVRTWGVDIIVSPENVLIDDRKRVVRGKSG